MGHDGHGRQRGAARDLGLRRARRQRLRPARDQRELPAGTRALGSPRARGPARRPRQHPVHVSGAACRGLRDRRDGRGRPRAGDDASVRLVRGAQGPLRCARARPSLPCHEGGRRRHGLRAPSRGAEGRGDALARRAVRARPALGRVHGGRPHPPRRVARLGAARPRERCRGDVPDPRRGGRPAGRGRRRQRRRARLRPRRRLAQGRRQPQRLARAGGVPRLRRPVGEARPPVRRQALRAEAAPAEAAAVPRQAARPRAPREDVRAAPVLGRRLGANESLLVRDVREHRRQRARARGAGDRRPGRGVRARSRRAGRAGARDPRPGRAAASSPPSTAARTSSTAPSWRRSPTCSSSSATTSGSARGT